MGLLAASQTNTLPIQPVSGGGRSYGALSAVIWKRILQAAFNFPSDLSAVFLGLLVAVCLVVSYKKVC